MSSPSCQPPPRATALAGALPPARKPTGPPRAAAALLVVLGLLLPATAAAKHPEADRLARLGQAAYGQKRYAEALGHFEAGYGLDPSPVFLFNGGRCLERLRRYPEAVDRLEAYLAAAPRAPNRQTVKRLLGDLVPAAQKTHARVAVQSVPAGATVTAGDSGPPLGTTPLRVWLPHGEQMLHFDAPGFLPLAERVHVAADGDTTVAVSLVSERAPGQLDVQGLPLGAEIFVNDHSVGLAPLPAPLDLFPGEYRLAVWAPGFERYEQTVRIAPAAPTRVPVQLVVPGAPKPPEALPPPPRPRRTAVPWPAWTTIGLTAAGLTLGITFNVLAYEAAQDYKRLDAAEASRRHDLLEKRDRYHTAWVASFGVAGATAAATGVILLVHHLRPEPAAKPPRVTVVPNPGNLGGLLVGRF